MRPRTRTNLLTFSIAVLVTATIAHFALNKWPTVFNLPMLLMPLIGLGIPLLFKVLHAPKGRENAIIAGAYIAAVASSLVFFLMKFNAIQGFLLILAYLSLSLLILDLLETIWLDLMNLNYPIIHLMKINLSKKEQLMGLIFGLIFSATMLFRSNKLAFFNQASIAVQALAIFLSPVSYILGTAVFAIVFNIMYNMSNMSSPYALTLFDSILALGIVSLLEIAILYYKNRTFFENTTFKINYLYLFTFLLFIFILTIFQRKIIEINISFITISLSLIIISLGLARVRGEGLFIPLGIQSPANALLALTLFFPLPATLFEGLCFQSLKKKRERTRYILFLSGVTSVIASMLYVFENGAYNLGLFSRFTAVTISHDVYIFLLVAVAVELLRTFFEWLPLTPYAIPHGIIVGQNTALLAFSIIAGAAKYFIIKTDIKLYAKKIRPFAAGFAQATLLILLLSALRF